MSRILRIPGRFVLAAAFAGSLAFGLAQATAAPAIAQSYGCTNEWCAANCGGLGHCTDGYACACY